MKYINMLWAAILAGLLALGDRFIALLDRLPGFPNFLSVDYALKGFDKVEARLRAAQQVASDRADRFERMSDMYADLSDAAEAEADRAARVVMRLNKLLD